MKGTRNQNTKQSKQGMNTIPKPEIRDDLDSREHSEYNRNTNAGKIKKVRREGRKNLL